jgi:hypothetical protein
MFFKAALARSKLSYPVILILASVVKLRCSC